MKKAFCLLPAIVLAILIFSGCSTDNETANLKMVLVDSPGDYEAVWVDIQSVQVHSNAESPENDAGWTILENSNVGKINLLDYTGGNELLITDSEFPTGKISQIRLVLGSDNEVTIDSVDYPLMTPSAQQSGLKLLVNETLLAGVNYKFTLDFDAAKSVVVTGNKIAGAGYILKPVIRVITEATSGAIHGFVNPAEENVAVIVLSGADTVGTSYAPVGINEFLVQGVPAGTYTVVLDPGETSGFDPVEFTGVNVNVGEVTELGTTEL